MESISVYRKPVKLGGSQAVTIPSCWFQMRKMHGRQGDLKLVVVECDPNDCSIRITEAAEEDKHVQPRGEKQQ